MSHRRQFLNLVTRNWVTGVHSLRRVDLHSRHNNLFYPTPAAARQAAAAKDPSALFSDDVDGRPGKEALRKVPRIRLPAPAQNFRRGHLPSSYGMHCAAPSESETVFLDKDYTSRSAAFVYDAGGRCVVTLPNDLHVSTCQPICLSVTSVYLELEHDTVYVMESSPRPDGDTEEKRMIQLQALVHRKAKSRLCDQGDWRWDELPPPPYVVEDGYLSTAIDSHTVVGDAADVICISTGSRRIGTYCFDTASRTWSKAGDWALPFFGKIEHDPDLGIWVGFLDDSARNDDASRMARICASTDLFSTAERGRMTRCRDAYWVTCREDCKDLDPPDGWRINGRCRLVSLGSGKFCLVQFFETREEACTCCEHEEVEDRFVVFTGVEVIRISGSGGKGGDDEQPGDGSAKEDESTGGELRIVIHKSKRYMLTNIKGTIDFVL